LPPNRNAQLSPIVIIIIMGVSGCGKSTVGKLLAPRLGATFFDADDFHPPANVEKMRNGPPLTDEDRAGWLDRLRALIADNAIEVASY
jgi:gluconokinase